MPIPTPAAENLWTTLSTDENYAGLTEYVQAKLGAVKTDLTNFRDAVQGSVSSAQLDDLDNLIAAVCHPPPGCGG